MCLAAAGPARADGPVVPTRLAGHAALPPLVTATLPADAPQDAAISVKFLRATRTDTPGSLPGVGGIHPPFAGQPVKGLSGFAMDRAVDGSAWVISDNGFGRKRNSPDVLLALHRIAPDFPGGKIDVRETIFLSDPQRRVPFRIVHDGTAQRYLTGADFDPESLQIADGSFWFGDEFGPWLVRADMAGRIEAVYPARIDGITLHSPDHPRNDALSVPGRDWQVPRSKGFEGLALQPGTGLLWAMLEAPLPRHDGTREPVVTALAFDPRAARWTGARMTYRLGRGAVAVGDVNFIDTRFALVIERDAGNGTDATACTVDPVPPCHRDPARVKRVVIVDTAPAGAPGTMAPTGTIDLMNIADPRKRALPGTARADGTFAFPFVTVEAVMMWDDGDILVANDDNLPGQDGRDPAAAARTEIIRLDPGGAVRDLMRDEL